MEKIRNIKSVQVFMAVANAGNATSAASYLNTSQSSVSYHIKKLEDEVGVPLFERSHSGLELTEEGIVLASYAERGLTLIQTGLDKIEDMADSTKVALLPMFASRWLASRLGDFWERHPKLPVLVQTHNNTYTKLDRPEHFADLGVQWGTGGWRRFNSTRLWPEKMVVVCNPKYLEANRIKTPADLARCTLLHVDDETMWREWCTNNGQTLSNSQPQMILEDRHFQLSSTINGLGVSLFAKWLVQKEIEEGVLVDVFNRDYDTSFAYHLISPKDSPLTQSAQKFQNWFFKQCEEFGPYR